MITVIGDIFIDVIAPIKDLQFGYTYHDKIKTFFGGTANVAVQISRLGDKVKFIGKVGNDTWGKSFKEHISFENVIDLTSVDIIDKTGLCISFYNNNERVMIADRGANDNLVREDILPFIDEIIKSKFIYFSGYSLVSNKVGETILYLIEKCKTQGCKIVFNPGAPNIIKSSFKDIIRNNVDILLLNLDEGKYLSGKDDIDDIIYNLKKLTNEGVVTMGAVGCTVFEGENKIFVPSEKMIECIDTTGAGDVFSAGFLSGKLKNLDNIASAKLGNDTAFKFLINKN